MEAATLPGTEPAPRPRQQQAEKASKAQPTEYVFLERVNVGGETAWREVGRGTTTAGKEAAIRDHCGKGSWKAIPWTNWKGGLEVGEETQTVKTFKPLAD